MKYSIYVFAFFLMFTFSCNQNESEKLTQDINTNSSEEDSEVIAEEVAAEEPVKAILLWNAGIVNAPSAKEGKWVSSYQFGNSLVLTGKSEENKDDKRTYLEVTGPDGKTGWINEYLVIPNSNISVALTDISLYKNPDIMSISSVQIKQGSILA